MTANLDIDLHSDVVLGEPEKEVDRVDNMAERKDSEGLSSDAKTLMDCVNSQGQTQDAAGDKVRNFKGDGDSKEVILDGLGSAGYESKMEPADLEAKTGDVTAGADGSVREENLSYKKEEEVKEETCSVLSLSSVAGDVIQVQEVGALGNVDEERKVDESSDVLHCENPQHDSTDVASDDVGNQEMEIDEQDKNSEGQLKNVDTPNEGVSQKNENVEANDLDLDVDFSGDEIVKKASKEVGFSVGDLVWGKVRSHPWWPGQIFGPSDASKKAKKYFKSDSYLIAYFGDQTFAWNEASKIKPFRSCFSLMEKQNNLEDFQYAVDCALDEISRRVEFGLACSCVPVYSKIRTQVIVNTGIREESCRWYGGDRFSSAACFEPSNLIMSVKAFGQLPLVGIDKLEVVTAEAQLVAFNRWKGYSCLPEFQIFGELLESDAEIPQSDEVKHGSQVAENTAIKVKADEPVSFKKEKPKGQDLSSCKRMHISGDSGRPSKKEKCLPDMMAEVERHSSAAKGKGGLGCESTGKTSKPSSGKKRKAVDSISDDSMVKHSKSPLQSGVDNSSSQPKKTYRVGDSILRVASQLNGSTPILKTLSGPSKKNEMKNSQHKSFFGKSKDEMLFPIEDASPDEMVSQLCSVARDPMRRCSFLKSIVGFFVEFKNSVSLYQLNSLQLIESSPELVSGGDIEKASANLETETCESERMKDSYWTDMTIQSNSEGHLSHENQNGARDTPLETLAEGGISAVEQQSAVQLGPDLECEKQIAGGILDTVAGKPTVDLEKNCDNDTSPCPTALILNFTDLAAVPSGKNLNSIFRHFGPLKESETEVLEKSKRAKVVFCRRADAETAFSSAGKYSVFGPSLVSYRLKYNSKSSPNAKKRSKKNASSTKGNAIDASNSDAGDSQ